MNKLIDFLGMTVGGWIGWGLGARFSLTAAIFLGIIGTALGLYIGRRIVQAYF